MDGTTPSEETATAHGSDPIRPKTWRVGTLVYSAAALGVLFAWLLWGDFAGAVKDRSITAALQVMLKRFGASDTFSAILFGSLPSLVGILFNPILSYKSDRHRGPWGRRIPFLLISIPFTCGSMMGLGISPWLGQHIDGLLGSHSPGLNFCVLGSFALFWTIFDFGNTAGNSMFGALINDVVPQTLVGRFFGGMRIVSLLVGIAFGLWGMAKMEDHYRAIFIGFGLLYGIGLAITCLRVREGAYPPPPGPPAGRSQGLFPAVKGYFQECFGHRYYLWFYVAPTLSATAMLGVNLFTVYYAKSVGMNMGTYGDCIAATYAASIVLAYPIGWLADKFHPLRVAMVTVVIYAIVAIWGAIYATNASLFAIALTAHGIVSGVWFTASASLGLRLLPRERFAEFSSAGGIVGGVAAMIFSPALGKLLDYTHHDYRCTFWIGAILSGLSLLAFWILHIKFMKLGGPESYVAP